jgi:hypothetical protein
VMRSSHFVIAAYLTKFFSISKTFRVADSFLLPRCALGAVSVSSNRNQSPYASCFVEARPFLSAETLWSTACSNGDSEGDLRRSAPMVRRRDFIVPLLSAASSVCILPLAAEASNVSPSDLTPYQDQNCRFEFLVPSSWKQKELQLPDRRKIILFTVDNEENIPEKEKTLMFIAYTPVRDDYTSLSAFGTVEQVGQMTILPKGGLLPLDSEQEPPESKLLEAISRQNTYLFDYTVKVPGDIFIIHHRALFYLAQGATGGAGSILVTVNLQIPEEKYGALKPKIDLMFNSFTKI